MNVANILLRYLTLTFVYNNYRQYVVVGCVLLSRLSLQLLLLMVVVVKRSQCNYSRIDLLNVNLTTATTNCDRVILSRQATDVNPLHHAYIICFCTSVASVE